MTTDQLHLRPKHRRILETLLREHLPDVEVWAYGSRVNGRGHDGSDLDLVLRGPKLEEIPVGQLSDFEEAIRESTIPFLVEARDWARLPERFHREIERVYVVLTAAPNDALLQDYRGRSGRFEVLGTNCRGRQVKLDQCALLVRHTVHPSDHHHMPYVGLEHFPEGALALSGHGWAADVVSAKTFFNAGDILFGKLRPYFRKVAIAPFDGICSTDIWVIRAKEGTDQRYLFYSIASEDFVAFSNRASEGTRMPRAKWQFASQYPLRLPPLPEQRAIAHILGTLDDKIELNRRMNETLEAMAQAIFKDWFVDFGPTRARMEGREPYLPPEIWNQFPDTLDEEGKPEGWEIKPIGHVARCVGGSTPSTKEPRFWEGGTIRWTTPKDISSLSSPVLLDTERKITEEGLKKIFSGLLPAGTLLLSSRAPVGYLAIAKVPLAINQGYIAIPPGGNISPVWMLFWCATNIKKIKAHASGTTFQEINKRNFRSLQLVVPPNKLARHFDEAVRLVFEGITLNDRESRAITVLRDTLLPKLISEELRVKDVELSTLKAI